MENPFRRGQSLSKELITRCLISDPRGELPLPVEASPMIKVSLQLLRDVTYFGLEQLPEARRLRFRAHCEPKDLYTGQFLLQGERVVRTLDRDLPEEYRLRILEYKLENLDGPVFYPGPLDNPDIPIQTIAPMARLIQADLQYYEKEGSTQALSPEERLRQNTAWLREFKIRYAKHEEGRMPDLLGVAESHDLITVFSVLGFDDKACELNKPVHMHVLPSVGFWREGGKLTATTRIQRSFDREGKEFMQKHVERIQAILGT